MTGSLMWLAIAGAALLVSHFGLSFGPIRRGLVGLTGEGPFRALYSTVALVCLVWLGLAYAAVPPQPVWWALGDWGNSLAHAVVLLGLILLVCGVSSANPTMNAQMVGGAEPVRVIGILRVTRHPLMWSIGLWAIGHLLANGEARAVLLMASVGALALIGTVILDAKYTAREPQRYAAFKAATSNLPFAALLTGRQSWGATFREIGKVRIAAGVLLYIALFYAHPWLGGVALRY